MFAKAAAAAGLALMLGLIGCRGAAPPPTVRVTLAGAQVPVEFIESWLGEARPQSFSVTKVWPMRFSLDGFERLRDGACDLACTDRPITARELAQFEGRPIRGYRVAFYGYALYVHPSNPLDAVFVKHMKLVFQKKIADWSQLAAEPIPNLSGPIHLYGPPKSSRGGMVLSPLANIWFADATWEVLPNDAAVVQRVSEDPQALGFAALGYDDGVRYLGLRMERTATPAFPSLEEIETERYGLAKLIYVYAPDPPGPAAQAVLDFLFSPAGQAAMERSAVWPVPRDRSAVAATP